MSDRDTRTLERKAAAGEPDAAHQLHRFRLSLPCTEGGLAHELGPLPPSNRPYKVAHGLSGYWAKD